MSISEKIKNFKKVKKTVRGRKQFRIFRVIMISARGKKMANVIRIKEEGNRLSFVESYSPVVCGNSNYYVVFDFSEEWAVCHNKTAIFIIGDQQKMLKFEGNILRLPAFPNASAVVLLVHAKNDDELFSTTSIKIRLEPTPICNMLKVN